jgi:hypothetical protein
MNKEIIFDLDPISTREATRVIAKRINEMAHRLNEETDPATAERLHRSLLAWGQLLVIELQDSNAAWLAGRGRLTTNPPTD